MQQVKNKIQTKERQFVPIKELMPTPKEMQKKVKLPPAEKGLEIVSPEAYLLGLRGISGFGPIKEAAKIAFTRPRFNLSKEFPTTKSALWFLGEQALNFVP